MNDPSLLTLAQRACALLALAAWVSGCESYQLRSMVVEGDAPGIMVLDPADSRLQQHPPLAGAAVELTIDPNSISPKRLGEYKADEQGAFTAVIGELGAGFLQYELGLLASAEGHRSLWQMTTLPPRGKVLLIVLEAGRDTFKPPEDLIRETQRIGEQLMR